ncbi:splicing factor 3B subunit 4-like [Pseudophryne corroboree]|uniref:splicing factor 3B subunit 4-like n=1 Tax=Pseudophryne corroboree TaxID=495146 RepID=UPI003081DC9D
MTSRQDTYTNVVGTRLDAIEKTVEKMANGLVDIQKALADSTAETQKTRPEDHMESMDILHVLATSINRLVDNTSCLAHSVDNMSESQRYSAASQQIIAITLQMIYDKLHEPAEQHAGEPPHPPPQATRTPPALPPPQSWYGRSQLYQGYAGIYPSYQMPPPPAASSTPARPPRPPQRTPQPPRAPTPQEEEEDLDGQQPP